MEGTASCGSPSRCRSMRIRSSPNSSGQGVNLSMKLTAEGIELAPVAGELLALALDHVGGRIGDEALIPEHSLGACYLLAKTLDLRRRVAVCSHPVGAHDGVEDAPVVTVERDEHAAASEDGGRVLNAVEIAVGLAEPVVRLGPRRDDEST